MRPPATLVLFAVALYALGCDATADGPGKPAAAPSPAQGAGTSGAPSSEGAAGQAMPPALGPSPMQTAGSSSMGAAGAPVVVASAGMAGNAGASGAGEPDAGAAAGGSNDGSCSLEPAAGAEQPDFCPRPTSTPPEPATSAPTNAVLLKFVEGSHVRMRAGVPAIDPSALAAEDPGLLRCWQLDVASAQCALAGFNALVARTAGAELTRAFDLPEADLDAQRASGRARSGGYLPDLNLAYRVGLQPANVVAFYNELIENPLIEYAYFEPVPAPDPTQP